MTEYIDDVDSEEAVVVNREEIDYMEPKLVEAKSKMRDANEIPRISIQVNYIDEVQLLTIIPDRHSTISRSPKDLRHGCAPAAKAQLGLERSSRGGPQRHPRPRKSAADTITTFLSAKACQVPKCGSIDKQRKVHLHCSTKQGRRY